MTKDVKNVPLLAGTARGDITPRDPIGMGGYGQRAGRLSEGVHDPLYAKVLYLQANGKRIIFITTDLLCIPDAIYHAVVDSLVQMDLAKEEEVCISASHTHSGPEMKDNLVVAKIADSYNEKLVEQILSACKVAAENLIPAEITLATGRADFLFNRRQRRKNGLVDDRVLAMQIRDKKSRKALAVLFGVGDRKSVV
jgi:hypothetical protein